MVTPEQLSRPEAAEIDPEVLAFRKQFDGISPLDGLVRQGARQMLQTAIEAEVDEFLLAHVDRVDEQGRRLVVRNGYLPPRDIQTGAGPLTVAQPRVRDNSPEKAERVRFTSSILPRYLRRSPTIEELLPWLYLKGLSTGDFNEALQALLGEDAANLSPNTIVRLKEKWWEEYEEFARRDLSDKEYVYIWVDGIPVNVRLENDGNQRQCMLVLIGATRDGRKKFIAIVDGYRESEQSWYELLVDLKNRGLTMAPKLAI